MQRQAPMHQCRPSYRHCNYAATRQHPLGRGQPTTQRVFSAVAARHSPGQELHHSSTPDTAASFWSMVNGQSCSSMWQSQQQKVRLIRCCAKGGSSSVSGGSRSHKQQQEAQGTKNAAAVDDMEGVIMVDSGDEEEDEFDVEDDGFVDFAADDDVITDDDEEEEFEGDVEGLFDIGSDEDPGPEVLTGNVEWGDKALEVAESVLQRPENQTLSLYLFKVRVPNKTIEIRLDKLDDAYGSPGLEDIERFSRALAQGMEAQLGAEAAGEISFEVSSPGAERTLLLPQDLTRFKELPMRVEYMSDVGLLQNVVLNFLELDEVNSCTTWELADVKANQNVKGRGLSKKQRMQRFDIPLESLERVRIYVDF